MIILANNKKINKYIGKNQDYLLCCRAGPVDIRQTGGSEARPGTSTTTHSKTKISVIVYILNCVYRRLEGG